MQAYVACLESNNSQIDCPRSLPALTLTHRQQHYFVIDNILLFMNNNVISGCRRIDIIRTEKVWWNAMKMFRILSLLTIIWASDDLHLFPFVFYQSVIFFQQTITISLIFIFLNNLHLLFNSQFNNFILKLEQSSNGFQQ